jgi:O-antigen/teichoic acid export membrane protein
MKSSLFKSISSGYLQFVVSNLIALVLTPFILRRVTNAEYGLYVVSLDIIAWVGLVQFGAASVLGPKIAAFLGKGDTHRDQINRMSSTAFYMQLLYALAGMLLFFVVSNYLVDPGSLVLKSGRQFSLILGLCAFFAILNQVFSAMIIATKRIYLDSLVQIMATALNAVLIVLLIGRLGLMALAYVLLISNVLVLIRSYFLVKRLFPGLVLSLKLFERRDLHFLFGNGVYLAVGGLSMLLISRFDNCIIGKMLSLEAVTYFYITGKLFYLLNQILSRLINNFRLIRQVCVWTRGGRRV